MLSTIVAIAAFAPPAARTSPHAARSVVQPLRAAQPLCKVWDPDDKVIYVGTAQPLTPTPAIPPVTHPAIPPAARARSTASSCTIKPQRLAHQSPMPPAAPPAAPPHTALSQRSHASLPVTPAVRVTVGRRQQPDDAAQGNQGPRGPLRQAGGHPKGTGGTRPGLPARLLTHAAWRV